MADNKDRGRSSEGGRRVEHSGLEKRGGNVSPAEPTSELPQVPSGPAPGSSAAPQASDSRASGTDHKD